MVESSNLPIVQLKVQLPIWERKFIDGKDVVFYKVTVTQGKKTWKLDKRYNEFNDLHQQLKACHGNIPKFPAKTYFKLKHDVDIENRKQELHNYLQDLVNRMDMRASAPFRRFLDFDSKMSESMTFSPIKVSEINDLPLGGRDFIYIPERSLMFVAMSDMNITSRLDSYITNMSMPWEKKESKQKKQENYSTVGAVALYKIKLTQEEDDTSQKIWKFQRLWIKGFNLQTGSIHWCDSQLILFVGMDQGLVKRIKVHPDSGYMAYEEMEELQVHQLRVMGLHFNTETRLLYSISDNGDLKITSLAPENYKESSTQFASNNSLKYLIHLGKPRAVFLVADNAGRIVVYNSNTDPLEQLSSITNPSRSCIRGVATNSYGDYCLTGATDGSISLIELGPPGKEKFAKQISSFQGKKGVRNLAWREKTREIITGDQDGIVTVWSVKLQEPVYVLQAHSGAITQILWLEQDQLLMTCGKDKFIKLWRFPAQWTDEQQLVQKLEGQNLNDAEESDNSDDDFDNKKKLNTQKADIQPVYDIKSFVPPGMKPTQEQLEALEKQKQINQTEDTKKDTISKTNDSSKDQQMSTQSKTTSQDKKVTTPMVQSLVKNDSDDSDDSEDLMGWNN